MNSKTRKEQMFDKQDAKRARSVAGESASLLSANVTEIKACGFKGYALIAGNGFRNLANKTLWHEANEQAIKAYESKIETDGGWIEWVSVDSEERSTMLALISDYDFMGNEVAGFMPGILGVSAVHKAIQDLVNLIAHEKGVKTVLMDVPGSHLRGMRGE